MSPAYRLLLARLQELLPGWTLAESADGGGICGTGPAGESLVYSRPRSGLGGGWLLLSRGAGQGWIRLGAYSPGEVAAEVAGALGLALSIRGDHEEEVA